MSVSPQGISIQAVYRWYRDGKLSVNRQYQRKLVWTIYEKQRLVDSIINDYPIPLFLLAEKSGSGSDPVYEIIDGLQRLNAIFGFIENSYLWNGFCFDINESSRARQLHEQGVFAVQSKDTPRLEASQCANYLDYQLPITIFPGEETEKITDVFGRINSSGKQLSDQERRQAGVVSLFANTVRSIAAEIRGDVSKDVLLLPEMPEISIETTKNIHGYKLKAEEIFWCYQGILRTNHLRDSEDEQMLADVVASILHQKPIEASGSFLDKLYTKDSKEYDEINRLLTLYSVDRLVAEVKQIFSLIRESFESYNSQRFCFRDTVYPKPTSNAQKQAFYSVFMAYHDLIFKEGMYPCDQVGVAASLKDMTTKIDIGQKYVKAEDRLKNIRVVKGIIRDQFSKADILALGHGLGIIFDFENSIRRSRTETPRYEFKQGILRLDDTRTLDVALLDSIVKTISAIANVGPGCDGYLYLGIADKDLDANRIKHLDAVEPLSFEHVKIVGIDREVKTLKGRLEDYLRIVSDAITRSDLSEPLKTQVCSSIDVLTYRGFSVVRISIPRQTSVSFVGDDCYYRNGTSTVKATARQISSITRLFSL